MKIIAFDLEACNRYIPGSVFSIGVVEADLDFNIISIKNILINPEAKFVTKFRKPINFNIDPKELKKYKNFRDSYDSLKQLFSQKAIFLAHSVNNDVRMLNEACKRYRLPSFNFSYVCSQYFYSIYANCVDGIGLDKAAEIMGEEFKHHRADEDALMSLKLVKYITEKENTNFNQLLKKYKVKKGSVFNYKVKPVMSKVFANQQIERRRIREALKQQTNAKGVNMDNKKLASFIDHTILKPDAKKDEVVQLCKEAKKYDFASVCVNSYWTKLVADELKGTNIKTCTVVGFPLGACNTATKAFETKTAIDDGATEIDMVINVGALKDKDYSTVQKDIEAVCNEAKGKACVKVIIETCLLDEEEKVKACEISVNAGANFVKTSTGFSSAGATLNDIKLMRQTVGEKTGVKASGGIRSKEFALELIEVGASRIGASAGVKMMKE